MMNEIEKLFFHQEEPFGSASIYAQYCVMLLAKQHNVTVLLDGQGADEYLAGYHEYYPQYFYDLQSHYPSRYKDQQNEYLRLHKDNSINPPYKKDLKHFLRSGMPEMVEPAKRLLKHFKQKSAPFFSAEFYDAYYKNNFEPEYYFKHLNGALYQSTLKGGLQTLLRYADRNSMAHSREVRLPFLYHELVEFAFTLPPYFKINKGWTKWVMRSAFKHLLPEQISFRKDKIGYEPPQQSWLKNKVFREMISESKRTLYEQHIISKKEMNKPVESNENLNGQNKSWALLMAGNLFH